MDPQANATSGLGFPKGTLSEGIYEGLAPMADHEAPRPLRELTQLTEVPNLWLVPSTRDLAGAEVELVNVKRREWRLRDALVAGRQSVRLHPHRLPAVARACSR